MMKVQREDLRRRKWRIKEELERLGLTGAEMARRLGISRTYVYRVIGGEASLWVEEALVQAGVPAALVWPGGRPAGEAVRRRKIPQGRGDVVMERSEKAFAEIGNAAKRDQK